MVRFTTANKKTKEEEDAAKDKAEEEAGACPNQSVLELSQDNEDDFDPFLINILNFLLNVS